MTIHDILEENTRLKSQIVGGIWDGQYTPNINGEVSVRLTENAFLTLKTTRGISIQLSFWNLDGLLEGKEAWKNDNGADDPYCWKTSDTTSSGGEETRQKNIHVVYILKFY